MAFELVQTSQLFARTAAKIEPEWLEQAGEHLLKRSYSDPHWTESSARTSIKEHATLFGLPVLQGRSVDYAKVDPSGARRLFIEHALVRGEYKTRGAFQKHNLGLLAEVERLRDKARQSSMLADDETLFAFFDRHIPEGVVNGKLFEEFRQAAEARNPTLLCLALEDVLALDAALVPADYPDSIRVHGVEVPLSYRFDPAADNDGITLALPLALLPQLEAGELDWTIPAWHEQKLAALLQGLPRALRSELGVNAELCREVARRLRPFEGALLPALARALFELRGVRVLLANENTCEALKCEFGTLTGEKLNVGSESLPLVDESFTYDDGETNFERAIHLDLEGLTLDQVINAAHTAGERRVALHL
jgi:ATP-dependent helicase HrpA